MSHKGMLIVFEGISRSGKSCLVRSLASWIAERDKPVTVSEWNSYPPTSALINSKKADGSFTPITYSLLHLADFALRHEEIVRPGLDRNHVVIADRWTYTALTRDVLRGIAASVVSDCYSFAVTPDVVFWVDVDVETALERHKLTQKRFSYNAGVDSWPDLPPEQAFRRYNTELRRMYSELSHEHSFVRLDGAQAPDALCAQVYQRITPKLRELIR